MTDTPQSLPSGHVPGVLLAHHLKALKLPTILREYDKIINLKKKSVGSLFIGTRHWDQARKDKAAVIALRKMANKQ